MLVLGIAFFIKYAIDKNWINESGRVIVGFICGAILIGLAHYFRKNYRSFSSVLVGGGLTVFYFSIAFAFHQYHLIGQLTAFIAMVAVSAFAVVLSLFYNRQELAILATIGGFITPFLVSTGNGNYVALFTYLCILNMGLISLSWFKRWPAINIISLFFTTIIFGGWLVQRFAFTDTKPYPYQSAFTFAIIFYLQFVAMNIINTLRLKEKFTAFDFIILLSVNSLFYAAGIVVMSYWHDSYANGLFTLCLGAFNLILTRVFYRHPSIDRNFVLLLLGLGLSFVSLAIPVAFHGNETTLCWAAESVILLFLYSRIKIPLLKTASVGLLFATVISLIGNWTSLYFSQLTFLPVIINKGFITTLSVSLALFAYHHFLKKEEDRVFISGYQTSSVKKIVSAAAIIILYLSGLLELFYQFRFRYPEIPVHVAFLQAYTFLFVIILLRIFKRNAEFPLLKLVLTIGCFTIYLINLGANMEVSRWLISQPGIRSFMIVHWLAAILLIWLLYDLVRFFFDKENRAWQDYKPAFTWLAASGIVLLLSVEMYHVMMWATFTNETTWAWWKNLYEKAGLSILWSICSFAMMWLGMKHSFKTLRIISLTLFTITLGKLFLFDIRNIPPGGKIAAFILLGVLLLVVSFMYQRLKKIIIDNEE